MSFLITSLIIAKMAKTDKEYYLLYTIINYIVTHSHIYGINKLLTSILKFGCLSCAQVLSDKTKAALPNHLI